jgi:hypothetical protein
MASDANSDLSLAKCHRAVDPGTLSNYTTLSRLAADCAGESTTNTNYALSDFTIDSVDDSLAGYLWVDEQTSETYTMSFTGAQSRFNGRIRGHYQNYTWTSNSASFAPTANQDYTAVFSAPAISNINVPNAGGDGTRGTFYAAHAHDVDVEIRGKFHEDQEDDGFNHFATRYATNITKTVGVEDTYNGSAITCFLPDTPIELANGEIIPIEDLVNSLYEMI